MDNANLQAGVIGLLKDLIPVQAKKGVGRILTSFEPAYGSKWEQNRGVTDMSSKLTNFLVKQNTFASRM